jgi:signal transduction histidine kinase
MRKIFFTSVFLLWYAHYSYAQTLEVLQKQVLQIKEDTAGVRVMNELSAAYNKNNKGDSAQKYATLALHLADKLSVNETAKRNAVYVLQCKKLKATAVQNLGNALSYKDPNKCIDTLKYALQLWMNLGDKKERAGIYADIGGIYTTKSDMANAIKYYDTSINLFTQLSDTLQMSRQLYQKALVQRYMANYGDGLETNLTALKYARQLKDSNLVTLSLLSNGFLYILVKAYDQALKNEQEALVIFKATKDDEGIANVYFDMGIVNEWAKNLDSALYYEYLALKIRKDLQNYAGIVTSSMRISGLLQQQGKYEEALPITMDALKYAKLEGYQIFVMDSYLQAGNICMKLKDEKKAFKYYDSVMQVSRKNNDRKYLSKAMQNIASIYLAQGNTAMAIKNLEGAKEITDTTDFKTLQDVYGMLSTAYAKAGDYKKAYENSINYKHFSDSLTQREKADKIEGITKQLEFDNKQALTKVSNDKKIALQQGEIYKQKLVKNITIAGLIIFVVLAIILFKRFREKRKLNIALEQSLNNLKSTQAQLIQSEKMASLGELTAGIAHEIQNPLNFVNNFSEVSNELIDEMKNELDKGAIDEAKYIADDIKQNLEKINHHGKRADAIVKGMLQHSRTSSGQKEMTNINALCDEYIRLSYHGLRAKDKTFNADFKSDFDESIGKINIVPKDMGRLLLNLINNAFYAVNEKKKASASSAGQPYEPIVSISTKKINDKIEISVTDNGNGIPQKVLDKIFQPFFTTKPTGQGTGLGLSLSYDIVKAHGGELKVETQEGGGSTFIIQLPIN